MNVIRIAIIAAAVTLAAGTAPATAGDGITRRAGSMRVRDGAAWYAATISMAAGGTATLDVAWVTAQRTTATAALVVLRSAGRPDSNASLAAATLPSGEYHHVAIAPQEPAPPLRLGSASMPASGLAGTFEMHLRIVATDAPGLLDLVVFVAADAPVRSQHVRLGGESSIRAESSGRGSILRRDGAFGSLAGAGKSVATESSVAGGFLAAMTGGETSATFRRSAVALMTGFSFLGVAGAGSWQGGIPAVFTMDGDRRRVTAVDRIAQAAPPGSYRFRIEAMAAPFVFAFDRSLQSGVAAGRAPVVLLAAADADFPACTARRIRVKARARDRHPICGPV